MNRRRLGFQPKLIPSLATVLLLPLLFTLGYWQLQRAEQKEILQKAFVSNSASPAVSLTDLNVVDDTNRYRRVYMKGQYDAAHQVLLDNQIRDKQPGYHVYTPFKLDHQEQTILVNRGWVALGASRQQLPAIDIEYDNAVTPVEISGQVSQPANPGLLLTDDSLPSWPYVAQHIDYQALSQHLSYPLLPAVILLDEQMNNGYKRDWQPQFGRMGPDRHRGYAVQWFGLTATLLIIYLVMTVKWQRPR